MEYARFVADALNQGGAYALEAGTGTGKTFGYLVPLLEYLCRRPGGAVVVATSTKNLQDQMQTGELPALLAVGANGRRQGRYAAIHTAVLKGKNCYLCADALADRFEDCYFGLTEWPASMSWLYLALRLRFTRGEIESVARPIERLLGDNLGGLRPLVAADRACRHEARPGLEQCVFAAHRLRAEGANLVITNHYKLLSLPKKLLERVTACVVDEADRFPDNLRGALGRTFSSRELVQETLLPLLGHTHALAPVPWAGPRQPPRPLVQALAERLSEISADLYYHLPAPERPHLEAEQLAYELLAEAELDELTGRAALHEEVARALAETPLAADARATANTEWLAMQAAAALVRQRCSVRAISRALAELAAPLEASWEALYQVGGLFQPLEGQAAVLPFGLGQAHWEDEQYVALPDGKSYKKSFVHDLKVALLPLEARLVTAGRYLATVAQQLPAACALAAAAEAKRVAGAAGAGRNAAGTDEPTPDERLTQRITRLVGKTLEQLAVLSRLLGETPTRDFIPIVERVWPAHDLLGWNLTRQPANLWPYLMTVDPDQPGQSLIAHPNEPSEAFSQRRQAARQRRGALPGDPPLPLYEQFRTVIFTSATLYVQGTLTYLRRLLDQPVPFAATARIEAVFDHDGAERVVTSLPTWLPRFSQLMLRRYPAEHPAALLAWREAQCQLLLPLLLAFEGRTLVLFTSNDDLRFVADWLSERLAAHDIELLSQPGRGSSQWHIRRFRRVEQSVLLGVDRMWAGVDFPGATLGQVVVWRAPLPNLNDPLAGHRLRYVGQTAYWQFYGRPAARLKLRQGFGRLVRREHDQGAFVVLDARLADTFYRDLLEELPLPCQRHDTAHDLVAATIAQALPLLGLKGRLAERGLAELTQLLAYN